MLVDIASPSHVTEIQAEGKTCERHLLCQRALVRKVKIDAGLDLTWFDAVEMPTIALATAVSILSSIDHHKF